MPYTSKITTEDERAVFEQAKLQHYLIDSQGRFSTSPVCLDFLHWSERENVPYIIVRIRESWCDIYIDLPGKQKWTEQGYRILRELFTEEYVKGSACRITSDNAQFEHLPLKKLSTFAQTAYTIADTHRSLEPMNATLLRRLQRENHANGKGSYW